MMVLGGDSCYVRVDVDYLYFVAAVCDCLLVWFIVWVDGCFTLGLVAGVVCDLGWLCFMYVLCIGVWGWALYCSLASLLLFVLRVSSVWVDVRRNFGFFVFTGCLDWLAALGLVAFLKM